MALVLFMLLGVLTTKRYLVVYENRLAYYFHAFPCGALN